MTFPASLTLVTVNGQVDLPPSGGAAGTAVFTSHQPLLGSVDHSVVPPFEITAVMAADGSFTASLPATNDPQWTPAGWAYTVVIRPGGGGAVRGTLQLDYQSIDVQLADLLQVDGTAEAGQTYIPLSQKSVPGGVAALDADGNVTDADGNPVTGGEGGGTPSASVVSETSYGQSASAGTASAYSRGNHTHGTPAAPAAADISDATATGEALVTAASASAARTTLGLGGAAVLAVGTTAGTVAAGDDSRLSDARTPSAHASSHADGGSDEVALDGSQITTGTVAVGRLPTGTSGTTVALGNAPAGAVTTHVGLSDPHTQYALEASLGGAALLDVGTAAGSVAAGDDSRITGAAQKASNLSDLADVATARTNLTVLASILLGAADDIPEGTPANTLVIRTT